MFVLFAMGLEIAVSLGVVGVLGLLWLKGFTVGLGVVGSVAWSNATSFSFIAVPLFVFMSAILLHSGIGRGLFTAVARWVGYLPGIVPGVILALMFALAIVLYAVARQEAAPRLRSDRESFRDKLRSVREVAPVAVLILIVLGGMYVGVVTPTEAAALGSTMSLILAALARGLTRAALTRAFEETVRTTSMVVLIIIFASIFSHVMALVGAPRALFSTVLGLGLPRWALFTLIFGFLLIIAYALEELSVMIIILPILFPLVTGLGFDPVWFGVIMKIGR